MLQVLTGSHVLGNYLNVCNSRYVSLVFSKRASASSMSSFSLKWVVLKGSPASGRIEGSLFRTLTQKLRNVDESGTPSSVLVDSFESLMLDS
jgi:hypothetical protein